MNTVDKLEKMAAQYNADVINSATEYSAAVRIGISTARSFPDMLKIAGAMVKVSGPVGEVMHGGYAAATAAKAAVKPITQVVERAAPKAVGTVERAVPKLAPAAPVVGGAAKARPATGIGEMPTMPGTGSASGVRRVGPSTSPGTASALAVSPSAGAGTRKSYLHPNQQLDPTTGHIILTGPGFTPYPAPKVAVAHVVSRVGHIKIGAGMAEGVLETGRLLTRAAPKAERAAVQAIEHAPGMHWPLSPAAVPPAPVKAAPHAFHGPIVDLPSEAAPALAPSAVLQKNKRAPGILQGPGGPRALPEARNVKPKGGYKGSIIDPNAGPVTDVTPQGKIVTRQPVQTPEALSNLASQQPPGAPPGKVNWKTPLMLAGGGLALGATAVGAPIAISGMRRANDIHQNIQHSQYVPNIGTASYNQSYF